MEGEREREREDGLRVSQGEERKGEEGLTGDGWEGGRNEGF